MIGFQWSRISTTLALPCWFLDRGGLGLQCLHHQRGKGSFNLVQGTSFFRLLASASRRGCSNAKVVASSPLDGSFIIVFELVAHGQSIKKQEGGDDMPGALIQTLKPTPMLPKRVPENTTRVNDDPVIAESSLDSPSQSPQPDEDASTVMQHLLPRKLAAVLQPSRSLILGSERGWRADGVDMLLLRMKKNVQPAEIEEGKVNIGPELSCDGMKGYLRPCPGETHPLIFRSPVKGMEGILTNQLM
ncbi:hypothetical protein YC2023_017499 [Brassica napus]